MKIYFEVLAFPDFRGDWTVRPGTDELNLVTKDKKLNIGDVITRHKWIIKITNIKQKADNSRRDWCGN